jgi:hypothetical protein
LISGSAPVRESKDQTGGEPDVLLSKKGVRHVRRGCLFGRDAVRAKFTLAAAFPARVETSSRKKV